MAQERRAELQERIAALPAGNFTYKTINGKQYPYLQWQEKTTMIRQAIAEMDDEMISRTAFIQISAANNLAQLNQDLRQLEKHGFRYVFLNEVTLMEDFIEGAALFSDVFAASGMKIVLSGTDSFGFLFTDDQQLYDRCILLHTTLIPYREFDRVLGIRGIDEYIRYGGTMSVGGIQ